MRDKRKEPVLKAGDTIKCSDKDEMVSISMELGNEGIDTDFLCDKDGKKGLWLVVVDIKKQEPKWFFVKENV
jgi:hypothetical protein